MLENDCFERFRLNSVLDAAVGDEISDFAGVDFYCYGQEVVHGSIFRPPNGGPVACSMPQVPAARRRRCGGRVRLPPRWSPLTTLTGPDFVSSFKVTFRFVGAGLPLSELATRQRLSP